MGDLTNDDAWLSNRRISNVMGSKEQRRIDDDTFERLYRESKADSRGRTISVEDPYGPIGSAITDNLRFPLKTYYVYSRGCSEPTSIRAESKDYIRKNWEDKENPITFINED